MAAHQPGVWGIDLGQCALKAIRLEMKDGEPVATAFEYIEHPKILSQPDADPDEMTREALTQFLSRNKIRGDVIAISVPGQSGLARFVKLPPVDQKKVAEIVKFEAKQQIPFPLEEVVWDFQPLSTGEVVDGMALETEIGLFAIKRDMVNRAIQQFKEVNVEVHLVQMAPLSLCNFVSYDLLGKDTSGNNQGEDDDHSAIVALEIGTDSSNLVITDGGKIIWQRPIPIGGNHFTRALTKEMKLTFAKAEHLKRNAAKSADLKKILGALKQVLNDFVGEVQRSLGYFTNTHRNAQIQYMIGLGNAFRLPGLQKFLQEKLQLEVHKFGKLERTTGETVTTAPAFAENIMSFGVAYGLALQGLKQAKLQTNLLPHEVRLERIVRGKKPWAVAAAASLLFGLSMLTFARAMEKNNVMSDETKREKENVSKITKDVANLKARYTEKDKALNQTVTNLDKIGAGVGQRFNWQLLHEYVNFASPQPNGDKLVERSSTGVPVKEMYWSGNKKEPTDSRLAFALMEKKRLGITDNAPAVEMQKNDAFIKRHLIQINIAGINALYSDDLPSFFRKLKAASPELTGMDPEDFKKVNDFSGERDIEKQKLLIPFEGWIVEVRGYTYRDNALQFVSNTIIENLKFPGELKDKNGQPYVLPPGMKEQVEKRVGFLCVYQRAVVKDPVAGEFRVIGKSFLRELVKGLPPDVGIGGITPPPPVPLPGAPTKPSRDAWRPIGDMASLALGEGGAGGFFPPFVPPSNVKDKDAPKDVVARTEFVLVFVWRELITAQAPPPPTGLPGQPVIVPPPAPKGG